MKQKTEGYCNSKFKYVESSPFIRVRTFFTSPPDHNLLTPNLAWKETKPKVSIHFAQRTIDNVS